MIELNIKAKKPKPPKPAPEIRLKRALYLHCDSEEQYYEIMEALKHAETHTPVKWGAADLNGALTWAESPQGHAYWQNLYYKLWG